MLVRLKDFLVLRKKNHLKHLWSLWGAEIGARTPKFAQIWINLDCSCSPFYHCFSRRHYGFPLRINRILTDLLDFRYLRSNIYDCISASMLWKFSLFYDSNTFRHPCVDIVNIYETRAQKISKFSFTHMTFRNVAEIRHQFEIWTKKVFFQKFWIFIFLYKKHSENFFIVLRVFFSPTKPYTSKIYRDTVTNFWTSVPKIDENSKDGVIL